MSSPFDQVFNATAVRNIARQFGDSSDDVTFIKPVDAGDQTPIQLRYVIVGDVETEVRKQDSGLGVKVFQVRYFQLVVDTSLTEYSGVESVPIGGRFVIASEGSENWPVQEKPALDGAFLKCKTERMIQHEIGNTKVRGPQV